MSDLVSRAGWRWYGYGGHFIGNARCAFHLATVVGNYLVSTLGHYLPKGGDRMDTIGAGPEDYFETMVFRCHGFAPTGDPLNDVGSVDTVRYSKSFDAEQGHYAMCEKWADAP